MITKNSLYGKTKNVTVINFGQGTVHMFNAAQKEFGDIVLKSGKPIPLGKFDMKKHYKGKTTSDKIKPDVVMRFTNTKSIDVVIDRLNDLKILMNDN